MSELKLLPVHCVNIEISLSTPTRHQIHDIVTETPPNSLHHN